MSDVFGKLARRYRTPGQVQQFLRDELEYNREHHGETLRSAEAALKAGVAHCLEAAFIAAAILERHGYEPVVLSLESQDNLDHVVYVFQQNGRWGSIGGSRDEGLHGRKPAFKNLRQLSWSYYDPYIDKTGMITGYQAYHLDESRVDWRFSKKNVWKVETDLCEIKHVPLKSSRRRYLKHYHNYLNNGPLVRHPLWW